MPDVMINYMEFLMRMACGERHSAGAQEDRKGSSESCQGLVPTDWLIKQQRKKCETLFLKKNIRCISI